MSVAVRIPSALRQFSGGRAVIEVDQNMGDGTVAAVLEDLTARCPGVIERVLDEQGDLRRHVNIFVGSDDVRSLGGLSAPVADGAEMSIVPAVSGGA